MRDDAPADQYLDRGLRPEQWGALELIALECGITLDDLVRDIIARGG
jgi:hypothetical protein